MKTVFPVKIFAVAALAVIMGSCLPFVTPASAQEEAAITAEEKARQEAAYGMFVTYFDRINKGIIANFGTPLFTKIENQGNGSLLITATQLWVDSPRGQRNAVDFHSKWKKMNNNKPVKIRFVDEAANTIILIDEGPRGPRVLRPAPK